jgi:hypothetical protein
MNKPTMLFFITIMSITLSGCSFSEIFSKLATSDIELGAKEAFDQSKIVEAKQQKIDQMKKQYSEFIQLKNTTDTNNFVAYAFRTIDDNTTQIEVEAMLINPGIEMYEVWLRGANPKKIAHLGAMKFNNTDDYSFSYTSPQKMSEYNSILISREATPDDKIETIVMIGGFNTLPSTSSALLNTIK